MAEKIWGRAVQRSLAGRLEKLERRYKPEDGMFFLVWGLDRAGVDSALAAAREAGKIAEGDIVIAEVWPSELTPQPPARWIVHHMSHKQISKDEQGILCDIIQVKVRKEPSGTSRAVLDRVCRGPKHAATDYSNEELVGIALGRQLCST